MISSLPASEIAPGDLMTQRQVSELTGISIQTLKIWRMQWPSRQEGPPSFKLSGQVRYRRCDVEAWIAAAMASEGVGV